MKKVLKATEKETKKPKLKSRQPVRRIITVATMSAAVFSFTVVFLGYFPGVQAAADWSIQSFSSDYYLDASADGSMTVNESIDVNFTVPKHGIYRDIPTFYDRGALQPSVDLKVQVLSVTNALNGVTHTYEESKINDNLRLKIGDADRFVSGKVNYSIDYSVQNAIRFFDNYDELYWDVNGTNWPAATDAVAAVVHVPELIRDSVKGVKCFTGGQGSSASDCEITYDQSTGLVEVASNRPFVNYENLTLVVAFEKGIFTPPTFLENWSRVIFRNIGILLPLVALLVSYKYWKKYGKDPKNRGVVVPQYTPPDGLTPAELGTIADYTADNRDISAIIIDLAIRGYIKIEDTTKREKTKNRKYIFHLLRTDTKDLKEYEKLFLEGMFSDFKKGTSVKMDSLKNKFYKISEQVKSDLYSSLVDSGYFASHPKKKMNVMLGLGFGIALVGFFSLGPTEASYLGWSLGLVLSGSVVAITAWFMPKRTIKGAETQIWAEGMKMYMELAEKDRLEVMQGADSRYIGDTTSPTFNVELFERLLPYAIVMRVEKSWASKFKDIYSEPPDWYTGNWKTFNTAQLVSVMSNGVNSMNTTLSSKPSSSSGSGFSGGGSSGGGFGGGGGGSW